MTTAETLAATPSASTGLPRLWKGGAFVDDRFAAIEDDADIMADDRPIVSLARWRRDRETLIARNTPLGLAIQPGEDWADIVADLGRFAVIAVAIPKYADGRAFSIGRLLRQRDGFAGELRATGMFIIDQVPMLRRVGFDAYVVSDPILARQLQAGDWPEVTAYLQPVDEAKEVPAGTRPWTRRPTVKGC